MLLIRCWCCIYSLQQDGAPPALHSQPVQGKQQQGDTHMPPSQQATRETVTAPPPPADPNLVKVCWNSMNRMSQMCRPFSMVHRVCMVVRDGGSMSIVMANRQYNIMNSMMVRHRERRYCWDDGMRTHIGSGWLIIHTKHRLRLDLLNIEECKSVYVVSIYIGRQHSTSSVTILHQRRFLWWSTKATYSWSTTTMSRR
jgi:hypothetical protein